MMQVILTLFSSSAVHSSGCFDASGRNVRCACQVALCCALVVRVLVLSLGRGSFFCCSLFFFFEGMLGRVMGWVGVKV